MPSEKFLRQRQKEKDIGIDPIFLNAHSHKSLIVLDRKARRDASEQWQKLSKEWDKEH